jgi:hypothetical protein
VKLKVRQSGREDACVAAEEGHGVNESMKQEEGLMDVL